MTDFEAHRPNEGFDGNERPPWQMVPLGGSRRVVMIDGAGTTPRIADPAIATLSTLTAQNGRARRELTLHGRSIGVTEVRVADANGRLIARLVVSVKRRLRRTLSFAYPVDAGNRRSRRPHDAARLRSVTAVVNEVYLRQANVEIAFARTITGRRVPFLFPTGPNGHILAPYPDTAPRPPLWNALVQIADPSATHTVSFVPPRFTISTGAVFEGYSDPRTTFSAISDEFGGTPNLAAEPLGLAIAHEIGHTMGFTHPDIGRGFTRLYLLSPELLMHSTTNPARRRMRRVEIDQINP
jgi:hypothetical protein